MLSKRRSECWGRYVSSTLPIPGIFEPFSSLSHLTAACIFAVASIWLLRRGQGNVVRMVSLIVFSVATVFLLTISGLYHSLEPGNTRTFLQRLDHGAIFVLIAATFTPVHTLLFQGWRRSGALLLIWTVALLGIGLKMIYFDSMPRWLGISLYLGMGWLGVFTGTSLIGRYGWNFVQPLAWGGLAYTVGAVAEGLCWPVLLAGVVQWHETLHVAVLIGLCCHWSFIYQIADGHVESKVEGGKRLGHF